MGRHKNPYRKLLTTVSVSEEAAKFLKGYGGTLSKEPLYRRLDRLIANCKDSEPVQLAGIVESQKSVIEYYTKRIDILEEERRQTSLVP